MTDNPQDSSAPQNGSESPQDEADVFLLIPASSREGFTERVCGLPGNEEGCWRYREVKYKNFVLEIDKGIKPAKDNDQSELAAWLVFELPKQLEQDRSMEDQYETIVSREKPEMKPGYHQMFFGFTPEGLEALKKINREDFQAQCESVNFPNYVEYWGWSNEENKHLNIRNWLRDEGSGPGLSDYFGRLTFVEKDIKKPSLQLDVKCRLSDLLREYLNHNQGCKFRRDPETRGIGITLCKAEIGIGKVSASKSDSNLLNACAISFSYADPDTLDIKPLPKWNIGCHNPVLEKLQRSPDNYFKPLPVFRAAGTDKNDINFAMCLSRDGRHFILPSEVGKSFLSFPVGEIASYLLHWFLLRIFAENSECNVNFVAAFETWRNALGNEDDEHLALFARLLEMPVTLPVDENVFTDKVLNLQAKDSPDKEMYSSVYPDPTPLTYLGVYPDPTPLGQALETLSLGIDKHYAWIYSTIEFLKTFFSAQTADEKLVSLPMYQPLNWSRDESLDKIGGATSRTEALEAIFACMANSSGLTTAEAAKDELPRHVQRCVFPIAEVLSTRQFDNELPFYYIFPLWEDVIKNQRRPIVFAHVFTRALTPTSDSLSLDRQAIFTTGSTLQRLLLPAGAAIAHDFYNRERKKIERSDQQRKTAWTQARAWAHEVKNYTSPIITDLGHSALGDVQNVSEEARVIIARARRAMLILNAASKAIQLAISKLANISKADEELEELPREYAREIVEAVLQYLLNYRVETLSKNLIFKWEPHYSSHKAIEKLSDILRAIGKKLDRQDIERTVLGDKVVIGVIALLREVIGNIRMDSPYESPGIINISYSFINQDNDWLVLDLLQDQVETVEGEEMPDEYPGVKMANELLGENCAKFGSIKSIKTLSIPRPEGKVFDVRYRVQVKFALSKKSYSQNKEIPV